MPGLPDPPFAREIEELERKLIKAKKKGDQEKIKKLQEEIRQYNDKLAKYQGENFAALVNISLLVIGAMLLTILIQWLIGLKS